MKHSIFTKDQHKHSVWAGGTTTQLIISPADADYAKRNFDFRISSAVVESEESDFTPLPGVNRKLMLLNGSIVINHKDHYRKQLLPFEVESFNGDWETSSKGICNDFNVMTTGETKSELWSIKFDHTTVLKIDNVYDTLCVYIHSGRPSIEIDNKRLSLEEKSFLIIEDSEQLLFPLFTNEECVLIITSISK